MAREGAAGSLKSGHQVDLGPALVGFIALLMLAPSNQVFAPVGGAGTLAGMYGVLLFALWCFLRVSRSRLLGAGGTPIHLAVLVFATAMTASYVVGVTRPLLGIELRAMDRGMLALASSCGVFLIAADGIRSIARLQWWLKGLSLFMILEAGIAMSQYLLKRNILAEISLPGLQRTTEYGIDLRSGLTRVSGSAIHSIEYATVQSMGLALVLHWVVYASSTRGRLAWGCGLALMATTLTLTVARSAVLGMIVVGVMVLPTWRRSWRLGAVVAAPFLLIALRGVFPGVLGTILSLFTYFSADPSTQGRTEDYQLIGRLLEGHEVFGRGIGSLVPSLYLILDNEYLLTLVTAGFLGLAALVLLFGTAVREGLAARRRMSDDALRSLGYSLVVGVVVAAINWLFFDGFSFPQATGLLFLLLGGLASISRLSKADQRPDELPLMATQPSRWARFATSLVPVALAASALVLMAWPSAKIQYSSQATLLVSPAQADQGLFPDSFIQISSLASRWMSGTIARDEVRETGGGEYQVAQGDGSTGLVTDRFGFGPVLRIRSLADSPAGAELTVEAAVLAVDAYLADLQDQQEAPEGIRVAAMEISPPSGAVTVLGEPKRRMAGACLLAVLVWVLARKAMSTAIRQLRNRDHRSSDSEESGDPGLPIAHCASE